MKPDAHEMVEAASGKVPEVTLGFWIVKIAATTLGETGGDFVSMSLDFGYAAGSLIFLLLFAAAGGAQVASRRFHPFVYWAAIIATTMLGTTIADFADRSLGFGYPGGVSVLVACLAASLAIWFLVEKSVSIRSITSRRVEIFYWVTILFSQTLGTALGDWVADDDLGGLGLGYEVGAMIFGAGLLAVVAAYLWTNTSRTILFWAAFVLTRPLGATVGDLLDKPVQDGGLAFSRLAASGLLLAFILACLWLLPQRPAKPARRTEATDAGG